MQQTSVLSPGQFGGHRVKRTDPHATTAGTARFSGDPGASKTMSVRSTGIGLPKAQDKHIHHNRAGKKSKRIVAS